MSSEMVLQIRRQALMKRLAPEHYDQARRKKAIEKTSDRSTKPFENKLGSTLENCLSLDT